MLTILSRIFRPAVTPSNLVVTVYTREGCTCCHNALELLQTYQKRHGFTIETVDIDTDPGLVAEFDTLVPVVAVDGKVRFKGKVIPALFERLLKTEGRSG